MVNLLEESLTWTNFCDFPLLGHRYADAGPRLRNLCDLFRA